MSARPLRIGIACFSTFGGSGVIASEIGLSLAKRGHQIHVFSDDRPSRLADETANVHFHPVELRSYPQLKDSPYALGLTSAIVDVSKRERLDVLHAHYAIPHAISVYLARQVLLPAAPALVTTLHGTDITLVGSDPSFLPLTRFSIVASDAVTTPSAWLREATYHKLDVPRTVPIDVIPNFVDTVRFAPGAARAADAPFVLIHVSNFRPLKRVDDVVRIFAAARRRLPGVPLRLRLVGDGPERPRIHALVQELDLQAHVQFLGERIDLPGVLRDSDLFLLPSETESFGLAALEAMSCGVPVVASRVAGIPEVVADGEVGLLAPVGDVEGMAAHVARLLGDRALLGQFSRAARQHVEAHFQLEPMVSRYEALYRRLVPGPLS
ncbi:MAG TPA: N-acetyl-alpha-D-glucosaminyl L-malate synthase BshA [Polyangia bacterium]